eukprot:Phypoly_transcript_08089.p1 GENE.Phypoly_transcript_08089~~Phypoly_transcript_08089.p1  ORF type:complete len:473 (+),score=71.63 Phypoly_transcript_08089:99-1517(+)
MPGKVLHIFDFDGTLFRSPEPNPKLWTHSLLGKIKSPPSQSGLGWYQELITLQAPYVHENPDISWFNPPILEKCRKSLADPDAITVLLTGRQTVYEQRVKHILEGANLTFHHYGLKPGGYIFTMDFKLNFISDLRQKYKDDLSKIIIYEDRMEHASKFENFLKRLKIDCEVVKVEPNVTYLDRDMEIELVKRLIEVNSPTLQLVAIPNYTGLILNKESRDNLLSWVPPPPQWVVTAHHMTMALGNQPIPGEQIKPGDEGEIEITHVGFDTRSLVVKVVGLPSTNTIPHVTIAHVPDAKPADSNDVIEWVPVEDLAKNGGVLAQHLYVPAQVSVVTITSTSTSTPTSNSTSISTSESTSIAVTETIVQPPIPNTPLLTLKTSLPEHARLRGTIHVENVYNFAGVVRAPDPAQDLFPKGVSIGEVVKKRHPEIQGKEIGAVIKKVREWALGRKGEEIRVEEIEDFIKNVDISNL